MNYFTDSDDWKWLFKNAIDWDAIIPLYYPKFPTEEGFNNKEDVIQFMEELLSSTGDWTGNTVAARARTLDKEGAGKVVDGKTIPGAALNELYKEAKELQYFGISADKHYGGLGVPVAMMLVAFVQLNRACLSSATQIGFYTSMIDMVERFCEDSDKERLLPLLINGDISGSMCLTEPGAGSDVGSVKTSAVKLDDGTYKINGSKIFITNGGGGIGFALARIKGAPEGLAGISLFLVEQDRGDGKLNFKVAKNEEKMGLHGSFTCEIVYEDTIGKLVGKEHQGFRYMLHLMNEARIAVGLQCLGGIEASISYARQYAETRVQFGKTLMELPLYRRNMEDWETERDAFRALMADTISHFDIYQKLDLKKRLGQELTLEEEKQFKKASKWVRRRTPLVKAYGAETFTTLSQRGIQALGGYGFIQEYDAERFHRDSYATLLYEGTTQIQSLMAMKDLMKVVTRNPAAYFRSLVTEAPLSTLFSHTTELEKEFQTVQNEFKKNLGILIIKCLKPEVDYTDYREWRKLFNVKENWLTEKNFEKLMVHAEGIMYALSYIEVIRVLSKHAAMESSRTGLLNRYKKLVAPRFAAIYTDWKNY